MAVKPHELIRTWKLNHRERHIPASNVFAPMDAVEVIYDTAEAERARIAADRTLTPEGKAAARAKAAEEAVANITKWSARLTALDANVAAARSALVPKASAPDPQQVAAMRDVLLRHEPEAVATLYATANDDERRIMEHASAAGRRPMKAGATVVWAPLLDPEVVEASILERAQQQMPVAAAKLAELQEVRAMTSTLAHAAAAAVRELLGG